MALLAPDPRRIADPPEAPPADDRVPDAYVSSNRTCELGLLQATGRPYRSVVQLVEELTRGEGGRAEPDPD